MKNICKKHGIQVSFKGGRTIKDLLAAPKDKDHITKKSGIICPIAPLTPNIFRRFWVRIWWIYWWDKYAGLTDQSDDESDTDNRSDIVISNVEAIQNTLPVKRIIAHLFRVVCFWLLVLLDELYTITSDKLSAAASKGKTFVSPASEAKKNVSPTRNNNTVVATGSKGKAVVSSAS